MSMLFDFKNENGESPEDAPKKKVRKRSSSKVAAPAEAADDVEENPFGPRSHAVAGFIGIVSDCGTKCERCGADEYDVDEEHGGLLAVECAFCGMLATIRRPANFSVSRIQSGQLAGLTVSQALRVNRRVVEHLAASNPAIRAELMRAAGATVVS